MLKFKYISVETGETLAELNAAKGAQIRANLALANTKGIKQEIVNEATAYLWAYMTADSLGRIDELGIEVPDEPTVENVSLLMDKVDVEIHDPAAEGAEGPADENPTGTPAERS